MDEYAQEKRTENNLIVRSGVSEAEATNNKRCDQRFVLKLYRHEASCGLFATAELLITFLVCDDVVVYCFSGCWHGC